MLASDVAETQQGGVLDGIEQYSLPQSTVTRIAKAAVRIVTLILECRDLFSYSFLPTPNFKRKVYWLLLKDQLYLLTTSVRYFSLFLSVMLTQST
jgi:hypothetical protein